MKTDPRGVVMALRRAVKEGNRGLADFLSDEIVRHLERLDAIDEAAAAQRTEAQDGSGPPTTDPTVDRQGEA